jgi:ferredoxin/flavodoxin---NADP+ reductase
MLNAEIVRRLDVTPELAIFHIRPDAGFSSFTPGQYVAVGLPGASPRPDEYPPESEVPAADKLIKRAYSIGSSPDEREYLELYIALLKTGLLTSRLAALKGGDRVYLAPKITGTFTLGPVPLDRNLVLVSTGTGIAPFMSMLRTDSTWTEGRNITLLHGVRYLPDLAYREELLSLQQSRSNFRYIAYSSRDEAKDDVRKGYVQRAFHDQLVELDAQRDHIFLCGNPGMVDEIQQLLQGIGFREHTRKDPGNIHLEKYW